MKIAVGIPNNVVGTPGPTLIEWARRAEYVGFSAVAVIDRLGYPCFDTVATLSVVAGATERIGLQTNILSGPLYEPIQLAKSLVSLSRLSNGRLTLGVALGGYKDSYKAVGVEYGRRGKILDETIATVRRIARNEYQIAGEDIVPGPSEFPIVIGGNAAAVIPRVVRLGDGWSGGSHETPEQIGQTRALLAELRGQWAAAREGTPRLVTHANFAFDETADAGERHLRGYYKAAGPFADSVAAAMIRTPQQARDKLRVCEDLGYTEFVFHAAAADLSLVDRLADAVL